MLKVKITLCQFCHRPYKVAYLYDIVEPKKYNEVIIACPNVKTRIRVELLVRGKCKVCSGEEIERKPIRKSDLTN